MLLLINTTDLVKVSFSLISEKEIKTHSKALSYETSHKTLEALEKFLHAQKIDFTNKKKNPITKIAVLTGEGSFTGIRIGLAIAQALGLSWGVETRALDGTKLPHNLTKLLNSKGGKKLS